MLACVKPKCREADLCLLDSLDDRTRIMGGSQKRCTKGGDRVRVCITHLLSIIFFNIGDLHVSVAINI